MASKVTHLGRTVFSTPVIKTIGKWLSIVLLKISGWKINGDAPRENKFILIAAPHTSNWDFILFILTAFAKGFDAHWMGKDALFPRGLKRLMIWLGGVPIDRSRSHNMIDQMVNYLDSVEKLSLLITPEGTRKKVERWKTGFYHLAVNADLPLYLGSIDASSKTIDFGPRFNTTGNIEDDLPKILAHYKGKTGIVPENF